MAQRLVEAGEFVVYQAAPRANLVQVGLVVVFSSVDNPAVRVASVEPEVVVALGSAAQVASVEPEVVVALGSAARVASVEPEVVVALGSTARVTSVEPEVVLARVLDPYTLASGSGGSAGLCVSFASPTGFGANASCCDGFSAPACGSSAGSVTTLLAFSKATSDTVLLCSRGPLAGYYPTGSIALYTWSRASVYNGGAAGVAPIFSAMDASSGWRLTYAGSAAPAEVDVQYLDTGAVLRSDVHAFGGGDFRTAGWRSVGGFRDAALDLRAFADLEVGLGTAGVVAPDPGVNSTITLFGQPAGGYYTGLLFSPVMILDPGSVASQTDYYNDAGARSAPIYTDGNLLIAPRAGSTVSDGDLVRVWVVDAANAEVMGPVVFGTPAYFRGPWWGLHFADIHWVQVPWVSTDLSVGKTLLWSLQGESVPGVAQQIVGRLGAGAGGIEVEISATDGVDAVARFYDSTGGLVLTLTLDVTEILGGLFYYATQIGVNGTASTSFSIWDKGGSLVATTAGVPSAAIALNQDARWGRGSAGGTAYDSGTAFRWLEAANNVNTPGDYILGLASGILDLRGVDGNVVDDADQTKLWGLYDESGAYGSVISFASVGSPTIVVGS